LHITVKLAEESVHKMLINNFHCLHYFHNSWTFKHPQASTDRWTENQ